MRRSGLVLTGVLLGTWIVLAGPAWAFFGIALEPSVLAVVVNWLPGVWTLRLIRKSRTAIPIVQIAVLVGSSFIRLIFSVVGGGLGWYLFPYLRGRELDLVIWGGVFYLVTLVAETLLVHEIVSTQGDS